MSFNYNKVKMNYSFNRLIQVYFKNKGWVFINDAMQHDDMLKGIKTIQMQHSSYLYTIPLA